MNNALGNNIRKIREMKNISQDYIARSLGISQAAYSALESDKTKIDEAKLLKIASILDVSTEAIKNFNEQIAINSYAQLEYKNNIALIEKIQEVYEKLVAEKDERIKLLEEILKKNRSTTLL